MRSECKVEIKIPIQTLIDIGFHLKKPGRYRRSGAKPAALATAHRTPICAPADVNLRVPALPQSQSQVRHRIDEHEHFHD